MRSCMNECTHACAHAGGVARKQARPAHTHVRTNMQACWRRSRPSPASMDDIGRSRGRGSQESARGQGQCRPSAGEGRCGGRQGVFPSRLVRFPSFIPECMHSALVRNISSARHAGFRCASFLSCMNERVKEQVGSGIVRRRSFMLEQLTKFQSSSRTLCLHLCRHV